HAAGDKLLKQMAQRLEGAIRSEDFVARFGGDEFIVLLPQVSQEKTETIAENIVNQLMQPYIHRNLELYIRSSIGISMFPRDGTNYDTLLSAADLAMYKNKKEKNQNIQFFTYQLRQDILERTWLEIDLRQAMERNQLELHYQPKIDLTTR